MKQVRLLKLELTNYRNIEHEVYMFDGANAKIVGENRIGKTNTLEAIYYLLSGYLLDGGSDIANVKPLKDTSKEVVVEGTFEVIDTDNPQVAPREITLKKVYKEKWVKQRGSEELSMQGHIQSYFINNIEQPKEKTYFDNLQEVFGVRNDEKGEVDPIQMLINPLYLGNLGESKDWQRLRTYIVKLIGDVEDTEIFEKEPSTKVIEQDLLNALGKTDNLKKKYKDETDTLNTQLVGYDSQVELLEKTSNPTDQEVNQAQLQVEAITGKINEIKTNSGKDSVVEQLEKEIFEVSKTITEKSRDEFNAYLNASKNDEEEKTKSRIAELNKAIDSKVDETTNLKIEKGNIETRIGNITSIRNKLLAEYHELTEKIDNASKEVLTECPTCHRPFDKTEIEEQQKKIVDKLTADREKVVSDGKEAKQELDNLKVKLEETEIKLRELENEYKPLRDELNELSVKTFDKQPFKESDELVKLRNKESDLKNQLTARKEKVSETSYNNYELVMKLESDRQTAQKVIDDRNYYARQMELLENVKLERKNVSSKLIDTEQKNEALKTYIYTKLRLLDEHIAKVFGKLRFQLIKENINGGFDPVCKPYIYDVDKQASTDVLWKNGSKSEKIITGIAIVEAIRKELDLTELPYLFDEGGEISNETLRSKFKTNAQIVCVRVEDNILKPIVVKF